MHSFTHKSDAELDNYHWVFAFCVISTGEADQLDLCYPTCYCRASKCKPFCFFVFPPPPLEFFKAIQHPFTVGRHLTVNWLQSSWGFYLATALQCAVGLPFQLLLFCDGAIGKAAHIWAPQTQIREIGKNTADTMTDSSCWVLLLTVFFFFLSHPFTYFFLRHFWRWLLSCRTRFSWEPGGRAPSASLIFFVMQPNVTKVGNFSSTCNWNEK